MQLWNGSSSQQRVRRVVVTSASAEDVPGGIGVGTSVSDLKQGHGSALISYGNGSFDLPLAPGKFLGFTQVEGRVSTVILEDDNCSSCQVLVGVPGPNKK